MAEQTTIPNVVPDTSTNQVGASAGPFAISWPFFQLDDVVVTLDGDLQVRGVDYNITATANDDGIYPSGEITFTAPIEGVVRRYRRTEIKRLANLPLTGFLSRVSVNADLNRATAAMQDLRREIIGQLVTHAWRNQWTTATHYTPLDVAIDGQAGAGTFNLYVCVEDHTSDDWATDLAAGKWQLFISLGDIIAGLGNVTAGGNNTFTGTNEFDGIVDMTGATVTVPTASPGDSDNSPASTAFVAAALTGLRIRVQKFTSVPTTVTVTAATPAVMSWSSHGLAVDQAFRVTTSGTLPAGMALGTTYYVISSGYGANSFQFSLSRGGAAVNTTNTGSGTHTATPYYVPHANMVSAIMETWGGGGGGGGTAVAGTVGQIASGGCGGAGGYSRKLVTAADVASAQAVTIGAAGAGGSAGANAGGNGGDTSIGSLCIGKGASGGAGGVATATTSVAGGAGGVAGTGDLTFVGMNGMNGTTFVQIPNSIGGSSSVGSGGRVALGISAAGAAATGFASGGGAGIANDGSSPRAGGAGTPGLAIVTELCSA